MLCLMVAAAAGIAQAQPATLRLGYGSAAEEPLWLLLAKPDLAKNYGKAYTLEGTRFTGSDKRAQAFEAGAIDLASGSANGVIFGAAEGVTAKMIASISRESSRGFSTTFYVKENSSIKSVSDLKGKTVGINVYGSGIYYPLVLLLRKNGLDPEKDIKLVETGFPGSEDAIRTGRVDVGVLNQPFAARAEAKAAYKLAPLPELLPAP
jgi:ABC-type nitrate/sulfonate/bicarbonate transport system substrate-binding protein